MTNPRGGIFVRFGGRIVGIVAIIAVIPFFILMFAIPDSWRDQQDMVIDRISDILGSGSKDAVEKFFTQSSLGEIVANPVWGSLILAFIFGMIFALALKMNQAMPVWIIAFLVVIIAMVAGMGSWAIPVTLVYMSEAVINGDIFLVGVMLFLILVAGAFVIGFGIQFYIKKLAAMISAQFAKPQKHTRRPTSTKMKFNKRGKR